MSKSLGNILDPIEIINKYGVDQLRYYLIKEVSLGNDGSISMENLKNCINNDLANNYGNLCQRVFAFIKKNCDNKIPKPTKLLDEDNALIGKLKSEVPHLISLIDNQNLNEFIKIVVNFSFEANKYFNDSEPWSLKNKNKERMENILFTISEQIKNISILLNAVIPDSTNRVLAAMNLKKEDININNINNLKCFDHKNELKELKILFNKIEK